MNENIQPVISDNQHLTLDTLRGHLPKGSSTKVTQEVLDIIHRAESDTGLSQEMVEEQLVSYMHLLTGSVGIDKLLNAIKFCNLRLLPKMGNAKAYAIVFPKKAAEITARGETVDSFASMFNGSKLVVAINKLLIVPAYITYQPLYHAAIKKQFDLMNGIGARDDDKVSSHVQHLAASKLAELTAMPVENSIELKIGMNDETKSIQQGLMQQLAAVTDMQMTRLNNGEGIKAVQKIGVNTDDIVEAEVD